MTSIEWLELRKEILIKERIKILDSFLYRLFRFGKTRLEIIEMQLDMLDSEIYADANKRKQWDDNINDYNRLPQSTKDLLENQSDSADAKD